MTQEKGVEKRWHGNDIAPQPPGAKRRMIRKRAALACEECRVRKRRCDGAMPACSGCTKRITTDRLEELENTGISPPGVERDTSNTENHRLPSAPNQRTPVTNPTLSQQIGTSRAGYPRPVDPSSAANTPVADSRSVKGSPSEATAQVPSAQSLEPCRFEKLMKPIDAAIDCHSKSSRIGPSSSVYAVSAVTRPIIVTDCTCDRSLDTSEWSLPLRRHADRLVSHYFGTIHLVYSILHRPTFMRQYERMWESELPNKISTCSGLCRQKSRGRLFPATVHAVFALASLFEPGPPEQNSARGNVFFRLAQKIDLLDILDDEAGIELVQLGLLMGFYLQSTEKFSKCWNITGLTIRMAQNMGLQLSLGEARQRGILASSATQLECEMRIRVWYGCFLLDREISMSFGRPLMIPSGGSMIKLPEAIDDEQLNSEVGKWNTQPKGLPSLLESYIETIKLYDILGQALDREELRESILSSKLHSESSTDDLSNILKLETKIMEWREALSSYLQYEPPVSNYDLGESVTSEEATILSSHLLAQATRLYTRSVNIKYSNEADLTHPVQCMLCADKLVKVLDAQIRSQSFVAWWYNVSYLHTSGSTILMGQLCAFDDESRTDQLFSESWDLCLQNLSRYTVLSTIAKKSFYLLQESAESLRGNSYPTEGRGPQPLSNKLTDEARVGKSTHAGNPTVGIQAADTQPPNGRENNSQLLDNLPDTSLEKETGMQSFQTYQDQGVYGDPGFNRDDMEGLGNDIWNVDASYWSFMPFSSQLEAFPSSFDTSGIGLAHN
ncbi:fungal-specific transcription factor domain-containing protein [Penicillium fimorum]|uniref:Fungal-specific transcription factor domain-containing protein n=1 Tax=Penicillium fimorum TaxID=1882269 RepID=A0A9W9Y637_9EURO|nr:fungal-specific transcription factor domain-containing protein [Penicillium fimorum]